MLCGRPTDPDWEQVVTRAAQVLMEAGSRVVMEKKNCRGPHINVSTGASLGGGSQVST